MTTSDLAKKHLEAGEEHYDAGRLAESLAEWREAVKINPLSATAHYDLGLALHDCGLIEEGIGHWRAAIALQPDYYEPHFHLAVALADKAETDASKSLWREIRQISRTVLMLSPQNMPEKAYFLRLLGISEWHLGDKSKAIFAMEAALAIDPDQWTCEWLGHLQMRTGRWRDARRTMRQLTELPDFDARPYETCGRRVKVILAAALVIGAALLVRKKFRSK